MQSGLLALTLLSQLCACGVGEQELGTIRGALCPSNLPRCGRPAPPPQAPQEIYLPPPAVPTIQAIAARYAGFDLDQDGWVEINSLSLMSFEPQAMNAGNQGVVLVLVEPRLLESFAGSRRAELLARLQTYRADLVGEGFRTRFLLADLYKDNSSFQKRHQDGRTLLAVRRFLKDVRKAYSSLRGVVLVGSFPDAALVRRPLVKRVNSETTFEHGGKLTGDYLELHPERITPRGDLVLADLDGNWESLYHQARTKLAWIKVRPSAGQFPSAGQTVTGQIYSHQWVTWEDFFYIDDAQVSNVVTSDTPPGISMVINSVAQRSPEITPYDAVKPNPIARPEITVSRIDAKGQALTPVPTGNAQGRSLLGPDGKPQPVVFDYNAFVRWDPDPVLEQRILIDYFARNHAFRHGSNGGLPYRTSAIRQAHSGLWSPSSFNALLGQADPSLGLPHAVDHATLYDFTAWLKQPAVLRGIASHSAPGYSQFAEPVGQNLEAIMGGKIWAFLKRRVNLYTWIFPSWEALETGSHDGHPMRHADYHYYRTLFENNVLGAAGQSFYIHGGCDANNPPSSSTRPYNDAEYGKKNTADSVLFFAKGLAVYARGKVFYDRPHGFTERLALASRFGYGWRGHFDHDADDGSINPATSAKPKKIYAAKKAYYWGLRGDWTLKLRY